MRHPLVIAVASMLTANVLAANCWDVAAQRYGIAADLLVAVAHVESNLDASAVNRSHVQRTGSYDIGLMQINSRHLPQLARHGIREADLYDACTNLQVGAWLLSDAFARHGVSWNAVGAYNAACSQLRGEACARARASYAWKVYRRLPAQGAAQQALQGTPAAPQQPTPRVVAVRVAP